MNIFAIAATAVVLAASSAAFAQQAPLTPAAVTNPAAASASTLNLTYDGIETQEGAIMVALFDSEAAYNGGAPVRVAMVPANAASVSVSIAGLAPGRYAIKSFHDIDGDNRMSSNPMGMPIEPFAFSNNARGNMGPATWTQAAFEVNGATAHSITIR
jgi:uncharacterized protein (DUF2141 family)